MKNACANLVFLNSYSKITKKIGLDPPPHPQPGKQIYNSDPHPLPPPPTHTHTLDKLSGTAHKMKKCWNYLGLMNYLILCLFYYRLVPGRTSPGMSESDRDSGCCRLQLYIRISIHSRTRLKHGNNNSYEHRRYVFYNHYVVFKYVAP